MTGPGCERSRVTLADIAATASVSVKTVSLALRSDPSVARSTAARVQQAAARLGYVSRGAKRRVIGVVVPYIGHRVYSELFGLLRGEASAYEFTTLLAEGTGDPAVEKGLLAELRWRGVDGIILLAPRLSAEELDLESRFHQPIVTIGMPPPNQEVLHGPAVDARSVGRTSKFARVEIDHQAGGELAVRHLLEHGRSRIAYLAGRVPSASDQGRRRGYQSALATAGIEVDARLIVELERHTVQPWPDYDLGYEQCVRLLSRGVQFDAILAYSDAIAIGAMRALHERSSFEVPADVSMIGFDGLAVDQYLTPKLTSVGVPWYRVALAALEALIDLMDAHDADLPAVHRFAPELIEGESVVDRRAASQP